jgi:hypothetical protein
MLERGREISGRLVAAKVERALVQELLLENRLELAMVRIAEGRPADAVKYLEQAVATAADRAEPSVDELVGLATVHAQLSRVAGAAASGHADRALALLVQAIAKGFGDTAELKASDAYDPLRERADFKKLLADLEAKQRPKAP